MESRFITILQEKYWFLVGMGSSVSLSQSVRLYDGDVSEVGYVLKINFMSVKEESS